MQKINLDEILDIARCVRYSAQKHPNASLELYCWCAICSFHIFKKLKNKGKRVYFAVVTHKNGDSHCFVICNDYAIDVTATQFNNVKEAVIIDRLDNLQHNAHWYWNKSLMRKFSSINRIQKELEKWPDEQNPFRVNFSC